MPSRSSRHILSVLFFGVLFAALDLAMTGPVLPALRDAFDLAPRSAAWVFNVFVLANLVGVPLMTRWADRSGRRTAFTTALGGFAVGAAIVAAAPTFEVVLAGRAVQGAAASGIFPAASAMVGDVYPSEQRGRALGILGAVYGIAFLIGPALVGIVLSVGHWSWVYAGQVPFCLLVAAVARHRLPVTAAKTTGTLDRAGILVLGTSLGALAVGLSQIDAAHPLASVTNPLCGGLLSVAAAGLALFVRVERRAPDPLIRLDLLRNRQVVLASLLAVGAGLVEATFVFFSDLAVAAFDVSSSTASFMLLPLVAAVAVGSPVAGRVLDRVGARAVILGGTALMTIGVGAISLRPDLEVVFYGGSVTLGLGLAVLLGSALSYILLEESEASERTVVQGLNTLSLGIGQLIGGAVIGAVAASTPGLPGYADAFGLVAVVAAGCILLAFGLRRRAAPADVPDVSSA